jgi:serine protease Do
MKRYAWVAFTGFTLGLLLAGYIFLYTPEKSAAVPDAFASAAGPAPSSNLFASPLPQEKATLDFVTIAEKIGPAVVRIEADRQERSRSDGFGQDWPFGDDFFDRFFSQPRQSQPESNTVQVGGTGFFITADGYILTNNHLVEKDKTTRVVITTLAGKEYDAKIVGTDPGTDLALLKIEVKNQPFAELGDSAQVKVGEWVLAIGNPLGMEHTVTAGIVSYKGRSIDTQSYQDFIQTDAAINRGNSGGPLINMRGEVVGITSNIVTEGYAGNIGIGFAIPSNIAKKVVVQLKDKGRVIRGRLGVQIRDLTDGMVKQWNLKSKAGAVINSVEPESPADLAKIKPYDVITQVNGEPVKNGEDLRFRIADIQPGSKVNLTLVRDGKEMKVTAVVDELEPEREKGQIASPDKDIGVSVVALTASSARRYGLKTTEGLLITEVRSGSEAERAGVVRGMIIIEVNRRRVTTVRDFEDILKKTASGDEVILLVRQEGEGRSQDFIVTVKVR